MLDQFYERLFICFQLLVNYLNSFILKYFIGKDVYEESGDCALVYKIVYRYKPPARLDFSCRDDFISILRCSTNPAVILKENISLYCINTTEAILVDCGNEDVFDSHHHAFAYNAQFALAEKVICVPLESFHKVASSITLPNIPMVHLPNHGRCGSTLLTKVFEAIPTAFSVSETNAFTDLATISQQRLVERNVLRKMCRSVLMCTLKHCDYRESKLFFLKLQNVALYVTDLMMESVPEIRTIYMYRQPIPFVRSYEKLLFANNWEPLDANMTIFWSGLGGRILKDFPLYDKEYISKLSSFSRFALIWITSYVVFDKLISDGYSLKSLKFEDFLNDPRKTVLSIFNYVNIDEKLLPDIEAVMSRDSQAGTEYSSRSVNKEEMEASLTPITESLKDELSVLCNDFNTPMFWDDIKLTYSIV